MNRSNVKIYLALCALVLVALACNALSSSPSASNFYMARNEAGDQRTTSFSPSDDFYVFFDVSGIEAGTTFESRWYALDVDGQDADTPFQTTSYTYEDGVSQIYFQLYNTEGWPESRYRVEVYMDGAKVGEQSFSVQ